MGRPVGLDDDRKPELGSCSGGFGRRGSPPARREADAVALEHERRVVLRQCTRPEKVAEIDRVARRNTTTRPPAGYRGQRAQTVLGASQERHVAFAGERGDPVRRIRDMHGRHGREGGSALHGVGESANDHLAPDRFVGPTKVRQVDLGDQDVVGAGLRQQGERARIHDRLVGDRPCVERVARGEEVRKLLT